MLFKLHAQQAGNDTYLSNVLVEVGKTEIKQAFPLCPIEVIIDLPGVRGSGPTLLEQDQAQLVCLHEWSQVVKGKCFDDLKCADMHGLGICMLSSQVDATVKPVHLGEVHPLPVMPPRQVHALHSIALV